MCAANLLLRYLTKSYKNEPRGGARGKVANRHRHLLGRQRTGQCDVFSACSFDETIAMFVCYVLKRILTVAQVFKRTIVFFLS